MSGEKNAKVQPCMHVGGGRASFFVGRRRLHLRQHMPDLVIVESPGKTRKINDILGRGFVVRASFGHVRDLPQPPAKRSGGSAGNARSRPRQQVSLGLDVDAGWKPTWEVIDTKAKVVRELPGGARPGWLCRPVGQ